MTQPASDDWVTSFPALKALREPAWLELVRAAHVLTLAPDTRVFSAGDPCRSFLLVREGSVRVQKLTESGREIVLYRVGPGQTCVLTTACLFGGGHYPAEGITETEVQAVALPLGGFHQAVATSAGFRAFVFTALGERLTDLMLLVEAIAFGRVDVRLAQRLLELGGDGEIAATHQQLAAELGTAREVVSRLLKEFERHAWVRLARGRIEITDRTALQRQAQTAV